MARIGFEYQSPRDLNELLEVLHDRTAEVRLLASGMALLPSLPSGSVQHAVVLDLRRVGGLADVVESKEGLLIGPMVTHQQILDAPWTAMLEETARGIGDHGVRRWGTVGGSVVEAHPASDWAAVLIAVRASLNSRSHEGARTVAARDFFRGPFRTALEPHEVLIGVRLPPKAPGGGAAYLKIVRGGDGFAAAGVAARLRIEGGVITEAGIGLTAVLSPMASPAAERALLGREPTDDTFVRAGAAAAGESGPTDDAYGSSDAKRTMVSELTELALRTAYHRAVTLPDLTCEDPRGSGRQPKKGAFDHLS